MTNPGQHHHLEIRDGDETVVAADVTTPPEAEGAAQASLRAAAGHITPGHRASLVDAVMDLPGVRESRAAGGGRSDRRQRDARPARERSDNATTRPAGSSALFDADIPTRTLPEKSSTRSGSGKRSGARHRESPRRGKRETRSGMIAAAGRVRPVMTTVGFIGSGMIGGTVARLSLAAGHDVVLSNSRGPDTLKDLVHELQPEGPRGHPGRGGGRGRHRGGGDPAEGLRQRARPPAGTRSSSTPTTTTRRGTARSPTWTPGG